MKQPRRENLANVVLFIIFFGFFIFYYQTHKERIASGLKNVVRTVQPCAYPLTYSIGAFDTQFGISQQELLDDVKEAAGRWETAAGKQLFAYDSSSEQEYSDVKINLDYDYRQAASDKLVTIGGTIEDIRAQYNALKLKYIGQKDALTRTKTQLDDMIAAYKAGGTKDEAAVTDIQAVQDQYNSMVDGINALVPQLNDLARRLNMSVDSYNSIGASTGREFDEGEYVSDSSGASIDIYQFDSRQQLIRLIEHELGHALGLQHVDNPKAVMYYLNSGSSLDLSQDDIDELNSQCKIAA